MPQVLQEVAQAGGMMTGDDLGQIDAEIALTGALAWQGAERLLCEVRRLRAELMDAKRIITEAIEIVTALQREREGR